MSKTNFLGLGIVAAIVWFLSRSTAGAAGVNGSRSSISTAPGGLFTTSGAAATAIQPLFTNNYDNTGDLIKASGAAAGSLPALFKSIGDLFASGPKPAAAPFVQSPVPDSYYSAPYSPSDFSTAGYGEYGDAASFDYLNSDYGYQL